MNTLKIDSDFAELDRMRTFLKKSFEGLSISDKVYFKIELALLEICVNIIRYAYLQEGKLYFKVNFI